MLSVADTNERHGRFRFRRFPSAEIAQRFAFAFRTFQRICELPPAPPGESAHQRKNPKKTWISAGKLSEQSQKFREHLVRVNPASRSLRTRFRAMGKRRTLNPRLRLRRRAFRRERLFRVGRSRNPALNRNLIFPKSDFYAELLPQQFLKAKTERKNDLRLNRN